MKDRMRAWLEAVAARVRARRFWIGVAGGALGVVLAAGAVGSAALDRAAAQA